VLSVACVLKSGGIYDHFHVKRLQMHVARHLRIPYRFVCLTDVKIDEFTETVPLIHGWPGWWAKIELFRPDALSGRVLYLDLDVSVVGDLAPLADFPAKAEVVMRRLHGDQNYITENVPMAARFPRQWCASYRGHCLPIGDRQPPDARVIVFHGKPKPWDLPPGHWSHGLTETVTYA
jgi:hypothetical protein